MKILNITTNKDNKDFPLTVTILYFGKEWTFNARDIEHMKKKIIERVFPFTDMDNINMDIQLNFNAFAL